MNTAGIVRVGSSAPRGARRAFVPSSSHFSVKVAVTSADTPTIRAVGTAEISLILSGAAAAASVGAVVITYRLGRERFEHERRLSDLDAVRRVLDDVTASMQQAHAKMVMIYKHLGNYAQRAEGAVFPLVREHRFQLEKAHDDLAANEARLEIRFGSEHELSNICRATGSKVISLAYLIDQIENAPDPAAAVDEHQDAIKQAIVEVGLARDSFTLAAFRAVGVRLPAKQLSEVEDN